MFYVENGGRYEIYCLHCMSLTAPFSNLIYCEYVVCCVCDVFASFPDVQYIAMTNAATFLPLLLWLYCCSSGGVLLTGQSTIAHKTVADRQECRSADQDDQVHLYPRTTGSSSGTRLRRSPCKPLGSFLSCYDIDVPAYGPVLGAGGRPLDVLQVSMSGRDRPFRLRLHPDDLSGAGDGLGRDWSSVLSPSTVVRVLGDTDGSVLSEQRLHELGITWYVGHDATEVAPSSVLANVVDTDGAQLFRAVVRTTSDVYYVQPASDYPEV